MNEEHIDPEKLEPFNLPENIITQLFEFSGSTGGDSGFILSYVNQEGLPSIITKANSPIIEMGLRKALEQYLEQVSAQEIHLDPLNDFGDEEIS
jgi:hypothetical protein|tara:strand:+ start:25 stop:306 length:282 start_codon:yes stop_codon:yes gene_type:complete